MISYTFTLHLNAIYICRLGPAGRLTEAVRWCHNNFNQTITGAPIPLNFRYQGPGNEQKSATSTAAVSKLLSSKLNKIKYKAKNVKLTYNPSPKLIICQYDSAPIWWKIWNKKIWCKIRNAFGSSPNDQMSLSLPDVASSDHTPHILYCWLKDHIHGLI